MFSRTLYFCKHLVLFKRDCSMTEYLKESVLRTHKTSSYKFKHIFSKPKENFQFKIFKYACFSLSNFNQNTANNYC